MPAGSLGVWFHKMKRHIGKIIGVVGILLVYPLSALIGPTISRVFFPTPMLDGKPVIINIVDTVRGEALCVLLGFIMMMTGVVIEIVLAFRDGKNKQLNKTDAGDS